MLNSLNQNNTTLCTINPIIIKEIRAKLPSEYYKFLDIFDRSKANKLPPYRSYNYKIELEGEE
jgi:hypothetical protein